MVINAVEDLQSRKVAPDDGSELITSLLNLTLANTFQLAFVLASLRTGPILTVFLVRNPADSKTVIVGKLLKVLQGLLNTREDEREELEDNGRHYALQIVRYSVKVVIEGLVSEWGECVVWERCCGSIIGIWGVGAYRILIVDQLDYLEFKLRRQKTLQRSIERFTVNSIVCGVNKGAVNGA